MDRDTRFKWKVIAEGSFAELRDFFQSVPLVASRQSVDVGATTAVDAPAVDAKVHRSKDGLIETHVLEAKDDPGVFLHLVRANWSLLRDKGFADAQPVKILSGADDPNIVVYVFRWKDAQSRTNASYDPDVQRSRSAIATSSYIRERLPVMNEAYQGFEHERFPERGGIELLRGKCTCRVKLDGIPDEFELEGQNGFVIMHRGPRMVQDKSRLMPVNILAHGADSVGSSMGIPSMDEAANARAALLTGQTAPSLLSSGTTGSVIRVEQNTELPQFGIIRAQGDEADFPATAMWVVHWKIHTPLGTVVTDPSVPLVFGPTTVNHYPPVGTEFKSATGPVDIYHQDTNKVVGNLTPGELTAFDIVVTMDDEIPSAMDRPAAYYVEMFNKIVNDPAQMISTKGLVNDYRIPESVLKVKKS